MKKVTAIFDIGKTNKKFILFDKNFQEVFSTQINIPEIEDEDHFPTDDLAAIIKWMKNIFAKVLLTKKFKIESLNFSTYGASFVHLDKKGNILTPLYNYLKPYPAQVLESFYKKYGNKIKIAKETASPPLEMLNSGLQLYWLKKTQPKVYKKIKYSLHFPQYLSYLFTGIASSEYTSIGCHTALWDFKKQKYHKWVVKEKIDNKLPTIVSTNTCNRVKYKNHPISVGVGIHDSSAALVPYILCDNDPFILISTGTWSITLNPFSQSILSKKELENDCLNFMRIDGKPVKAARLFLGKEYELQVEKLNKHFSKGKKYHKKIKFDKKLFRALAKNNQHQFRFEAITKIRKIKTNTRLSNFPNFEVAYHQLMLELIDLQIAAVRMAVGKEKFKKIYVDGGFAKNEVFIKMLSLSFKKTKIYTTTTPVGSALGAAMVVNSNNIKTDFLEKHYGLEKV